MSALTITAANVVPQSDAVIVNGVAGETITAGMPVYLDAATNKYMKCDSDSATAAAHAAAGIALTGSSLNQRIAVQTGGTINLGATLTVGEIYCNGDTAGGIVPKADLSQGEYVTVLGIAVSAANLKMGILNSGVAVP